MLLKIYKEVLCVTSGKGPSREGSPCSFLPGPPAPPCPRHGSHSKAGRTAREKEYGCCQVSPSPGSPALRLLLQEREINVVVEPSLILCFLSLMAKYKSD